MELKVTIEFLTVFLKFNELLNLNNLLELKSLSKLKNEESRSWIFKFFNKFKDRLFLLKLF